MKRVYLRHKASPSARFFSLFLVCLLLTVFCCAVPASGAEEEELPNTGTTETIITEDVPAEEAPSADETLPPEEELPENASPLLEVPAETVTLTFRLGNFGTETRTVEKGQYPTDLPEIPALPRAQVLGWYDRDGNLVYPESIPAEQDTTYTARWSRQVSDLLNTSDHFAYVKGTDMGLFRPDASMTRAEAAQMFYSLLWEQDGETRSFSDVHGQWYDKAVGVMAGLDIIHGYTDGTFRPDKQITRAEFVTIASNFDTLTDGKCTFSDVSAGFWAAPHIATAAERGWITGFSDGTFRPNSKITRAEAVTILNRMLHRLPDADVAAKTDAKNFYDVFPDHWAYANIVEASTDHSYVPYGAAEELWTSYTPDTSYPEKSGWVRDNGTLYYLDAATRKFLRGVHTIDGKKYIFNNTTGAAFTGFRMEGSWRRYYRNGVMVDDISNLGVVSGPYFIKVYKDSNYLIIFARDSGGSYNTPVRAMRASCGYGTITGTYYTPDRYRWLQMIGDTWAQWCTQIQGNYLFHSVPNWTLSNMDLEVEEYNHLGETRSLGCIRLNCRDAKWIFDNCALGTKVTITTAESSGPLKKPAGIQIPSWHTWDPTDPTAQWRCRENGCH